MSRPATPRSFFRRQNNRELNMIAKCAPGLVYRELTSTGKALHTIVPKPTFR